MDKKIFTDEEIVILSSNAYVKSISSKSITYTDEFKRIYISEHDKGKFPKEIFSEHGLDVDLIGFWRIHAADKRWRAAYKRNGVLGLTDTRKNNSGRTREKELSIEEKYERLKAQNSLLKAENELLKKLEMMERRVKKEK